MLLLLQQFLFYFILGRILIALYNICSKGEDNHTTVKVHLDKSVVFSLTGSYQYRSCEDGEFHLHHYDISLFFLYGRYDFIYTSTITIVLNSDLILSVNQLSKKKTNYNYTE